MQTSPIPRRERGAALLIILTIIGIGAAFLLVSALNKANQQIERDKITAAALAQAKDALIGRAVLDDNRLGSLPCPDLVTNIAGINVPGDGTADLFAGNECPSYVGWLPWRTLGLPELRDASGERLWYALSRSLRDDDSAQPINSSTAGDLAVGTASQIAAIVFAPGQPLPGQSGRPSNNVADYLDGSNADGDNNYTTGPLTNSFNDRLIYISRDQLMTSVTKRVAQELKQLLDASGAYPSTVVGFPGLPNWFQTNWLPVTNYTRVSANQATLSFNGCGITYTLKLGAPMAQNQRGC